MAPRVFHLLLQASVQHSVMNVVKASLMLDVQSMIEVSLMLEVANMIEVAPACLAVEATTHERLSRTRRLATYSQTLQLKRLRARGHQQALRIPLLVLRRHHRLMIDERLCQIEDALKPIARGTASSRMHVILSLAMTYPLQPFGAML